VEVIFGDSIVSFDERDASHLLDEMLYGPGSLPHVMPFSMNGCLIMEHISRVDQGLLPFPITPFHTGLLTEFNSNETKYWTRCVCQALVHLAVKHSVHDVE
jgi:hypothetical protein